MIDRCQGKTQENNSLNMKQNKLWMIFWTMRIKNIFWSRSISIVWQRNCVSGILETKFTLLYSWLYNEKNLQSYEKMYFICCSTTFTTLRGSRIENSVNIGRRKFMREWADGNNGRTANMIMLHNEEPSDTHKLVKQESEICIWSVYR